MNSKLVTRSPLFLTTKTQRTFLQALSQGQSLKSVSTIVVTNKTGAFSGLTSGVVVRPPVAGEAK